MSVHASAFVLAWALLLCPQAFSHDSLEVMEPFVKVHVLPADTHEFLILAEQGRRFQIVSESPAWCRIVVDDTVGWIRKQHARPWPPPSLSDSPAGATEASARHLQNDALAQARRPAHEPRSTVGQTPTEHPERMPSAVTGTAPRTATLHPSAGVDTGRGEPMSMSGTAAAEPAATDWTSAWYGFADDPGGRHMQGDTTVGQASTVEPQTALVVRTPVAIVQSPDTSAPTLQTVVPGTRVIVLSVRGDWCRVVHDGVDGWVPADHLHFEGLALPGGLRLAALTGMLLFMAAVASLLYTRVRSRSTVRAVPAVLRAASQSVLVVRNRPGFIRQYVAGSSATFESCLRDVGFRVGTASSLSAVRDALKRETPDIILVDHGFRADIHTAFAQLLAAAQRAGQRAPLLIFYHVPASEIPALQKQLPAAHFLQTGATDRELFAPITPRIAAAENCRGGAADDSASALEGPLAEDGMAEILQFIETGGKTGRLTVSNGTPTGVVYFSGGMIVHAAAASATGKEAVLRMLDMRQGAFRFVHQAVSPADVPPLSTLQVLMEWAQGRDEARRSA